MLTDEEIIRRRRLSTMERITRRHVDAIDRVTQSGDGVILRYKGQEYGCYEVARESQGIVYAFCVEGRVLVLDKRVMVRRGTV